MLVLIGVFSSCKNEAKAPVQIQTIKSTITEPISGNASYLDDVNVYNRVLNKAMETGDTHSYCEVSVYTEISRDPRDFLYYAMTFANTYQYNGAYFDVYSILTFPNNRFDLEPLGKKTKFLALYYLLKSHEMGYEHAKSTIDDIEIKCKCKLKTSKEYLRLYDE
jgi:hypothetical protein